MRKAHLLTIALCGTTDTSSNDFFLFATAVWLTGSHLAKQPPCRENLMDRCTIKLIRQRRPIGQCLTLALPHPPQPRIYVLINKIYVSPSSFIKLDWHSILSLGNHLVFLLIACLHLSIALWESSCPAGWLTQQDLRWSLAAQCGMRSDRLSGAYLTVSWLHTLVDCIAKSTRLVQSALLTVGSHTIVLWESEWQSATKTQTIKKGAGKRAFYFLTYAVVHCNHKWHPKLFLSLSIPGYTCSVQGTNVASAKIRNLPLKSDRLPITTQKPRDEPLHCNFVAIKSVCLSKIIMKEAGQNLSIRLWFTNCFARP